MAKTRSGKRELTEQIVLSPARVITSSAAMFGVNEMDLLGRSQAMPLVMYRQITFLILRRICHLSYPAIGLLFGRDHTTIMHGVRKAEQILSDVNYLKDKLDFLLPTGS